MNRHDSWCDQPAVDYGPSGFIPPHLQHPKLPPPIGMEYPEGILPKSSCAPGTKPARPLTYLASPYSHANKNVMATRYVLATEAAAWIIRKLGWNVFAPITHSHPLATLGGLSGDWKFWEKIDTEYLSVSERLVVLELDGWRTSVGVQAEIGIAQKLGVPVVYLRPDASTKGSYQLAPYPMDEIAPLFDASGNSTVSHLGYGGPAKLQATSIPESLPTYGFAPDPSASECAETRRQKPGPTSKADTANPKDLIGATKISLSKVPPVAIAHCSHAMMDGARKYSPYNWRAKAVQAHIYVDAALRHLLDWFDGEEDAPDSKVHHLGHAMACCAILLDCQETGNLIDDRPTTPASSGATARVLERLRKKL